MKGANFKLTLTQGLVGAMVLVFLVAWFPGMERLAVTLSCNGSLDRLWSFLTYPFAPGVVGGLVFLVLEWAWLYWIGSSLEKSEGTRAFGVQFLGSTLAGSLLTALGSFLAANPVSIAGPWLPVAALTCLWCARNPSVTVRLMMVIPASTKVLAVVTAVVTVLFYGNGAPLVGVFAALPCALAWLYGSRKLVPAKRQVVTGRGPSRSPAEFDKFMESVRSKEKERREQERLRKLLEGGGEDPSRHD